MKSTFALVLLQALRVAAAAEADARRLRTAPGSLQPDLGSLAMRHATSDLLHFLETERSLELASKQANGELPPYKDFHPACIAHTKKLITSLDRAYTDVQLESVLENECALDEMFVSVETGFGDDEACKKFAKALVKARNEELEKGSTDGYNKFCDGYYEFKGGKVEKPKEEKPKKEEGEKGKSTKDESSEDEKLLNKKPTEESSKDKDEKKTEKKAGNATKVEDVDESKKVDAEETDKAASLKEEELEEELKGSAAKPNCWKEIPTWVLGAIFIGSIVIFIVAAAMLKR